METIDVYVERIIFQNEANGYSVLMTRCGDEELIAVGFFQIDVTGQMLRLGGMIIIRTTDSSLRLSTTK